jgi:hypothetical protein
MSAITAETQWLMDKIRGLSTAARNGGIYANKSGYHNTRTANQANWPGNYSYAQFAVDREGPSDKAAALDITFVDAQAGNYATIAALSSRLYAAGRAGRANDPRTVYMREFFGNIDTDRTVEGWDFARGNTSTSDSSHLWHIHISVHRKYVTDMRAMRAILSILKGETVRTWLTAEGMASAQDDGNATWGSQIASPAYNKSASAGDWLKSFEGAHRELAAVSADLVALRAEVAAQSRV